MTRHGRDPPGHQVRVPHESWAGRPTWTPDGQALVYLSYPRDATSGEPNRGSAPAQIRRIGLDGTQLEALTPFR
ncbi:MAG: hypothetical protein GWN99_13630, partial [Gemmatimonadetes bacterium]|nr:hypothetical protein [Gemmatimonadota bacterium]NIR75928.1 hypothetical protein [Candidatus Kutchimonas denitrificans]NIS02086.1 hypothetical protein [Gemmatimonadota bacterium]NIT67911.1 hypothetical protein [Gemmatimonadota bacterium]NIU53905.1 hypothetical protein [Gemmatimonadota bacterium]